MVQSSETQVYRVVIDGYFLAGAEEDEVIRKLKRLFGTEESKIKAMFDGQPTIIKNQLPKSRAYQYLRTITNAGAACHIDKLNAAGPEETSQLPVHIDRVSEKMESDILGSVKKRIMQRNDFSEVMRQEIMEMDQARKKSDVIIISLFVILFIVFCLALAYLFLF